MPDQILSTGHVALYPIASVEEARARQAAQASEQADQELRRQTVTQAMEQRQAQLQEQAWLKQAASTYTHPNGRPDLDRIADEYVKINPDAGMKFRSQVNADRKSSIEQERMQLDHRRDVAEISSRLLKGALQNPASYGDVRKRLTLLDPDAEQQLPAEFDPNVLTQVVKQADQFAGIQQQHGEALKLILDGKLDDYLGFRLQNATSQQDVDKAYDDVTAHTDAATSSALMHTFGTQFGPGFTEHAAAVRASRQQAKPSTSGSSDYAQFLSRWAKDRGKTPDTLTGEEELEARRRYGLADDPVKSGSTAPVAVMGPDGKPVFVPANQAIGRTPASTREQGRPVTSGDANRIADFDTSLDDIKALSSVLGTTGTVAKIQSWMPQWVNELTGGWSDDAKSRNAVIARVKQVIGKALEGGVLRKEDEEKYKDILPTIYDSKAVAESKLSGLKNAITKRRQTLLESLSDAGFDTGRYQARPPRDSAEPVKKLSAEELIKKYGGK